MFVRIKLLLSVRWEGCSFISRYSRIGLKNKNYSLLLITHYFYNYLIIINCGPLSFKKCIDKNINIFLKCEILNKFVSNWKFCRCFWVSLKPKKTVVDVITMEFIRINRKVFVCCLSSCNNENICRSL